MKKLQPLTASKTPMSKPGDFDKARAQDDVRPTHRRRKCPEGDRQYKHIAQWLVRRCPELFDNQELQDKKAALRKLARFLPPYPAMGGRKPLTYISEATRLFLQQRCEVAEATRECINWLSIAKVAAPQILSLRSERWRQFQLQRLRSAVYSRLKRLKQRERERGHS